MKEVQLNEKEPIEETPSQTEVEEGVHKEMSREKFPEHSITNKADESHPLRDDVFQLDLLQTVLRAEVDTLKDIQMEFSRIREDMDNMKLDDPDLPVHVGEWRHYIRLLDTLLVHVVKELGGYSEIASDSVNRLFEVLIQDKKA